MPMQLFPLLYQKAVLVACVLKGHAMPYLDFLGEKANKDTNELCNRKLRVSNRTVAVRVFKAVRSYVCHTQLIYQLMSVVCVFEVIAVTSFSCSGDGCWMPLTHLFSQPYNFSDALFAFAYHVVVNSECFTPPTVRELKVLAASVFAVAEGCHRTMIYNGAFLLRIKRV